MSVDKYYSYTATEIVSVPVTLTTASGTVIAANANRKQLIIQNNDDEEAILRLSSGDASTSAYHVILSKCTAARDGTGGSITIDFYQGAVTGLVEANTTEVSVIEVID